MTAKPTGIAPPSGRPGTDLADEVPSSVGRPGTCSDNAAAESFFATLKTELLHRAL